MLTLEKVVKMGVNSLYIGRKCVRNYGVVVKVFDEKQALPITGK